MNVARLISRRLLLFRGVSLLVVRSVLLFARDTFVISRFVLLRPQTQRFTCTSGLRPCPYFLGSRVEIRKNHGR